VLCRRWKGVPSRAGDARAFEAKWYLARRHTRNCTGCGIEGQGVREMERRGERRELSGGVAGVEGEQTLVDLQAAERRFGGSQFCTRLLVPFRNMWELGGPPAQSDRARRGLHDTPGCQKGVRGGPNSKHALGRIRSGKRDTLVKKSEGVGEGRGVGPPKSPKTSERL
jgi:hypothetical protein